VELRATEPRLRVVRLQRNYGQTAAIAAGIELARGDVIASLDADLQNDPRDIPRLLDKLDEGFEVVSGWRRERRDPWLTRRLPSTIATASSPRSPDQPARLRLHAAGHAGVGGEGARLYGELHRFIPALAADLGARVSRCRWRTGAHARALSGCRAQAARAARPDDGEVPLGFAGRPIQLFADGARSRRARPRPHRRAGVRAIFRVRPAGRPIVPLAILLTVLGVQFVSIGLLGEMMVRTYHESQGRADFRIVPWSTGCA
jgi:hypothetical protein